MKSMSFLLIAFAALLVGCGSRKQEVVFAVVNGRPITESYVRDVVRIQARLAELFGAEIPKGYFNAWANSTAMQIIPGLIRAELLEQELDRRAVRVSAEDRKTALSKYVSRMPRPVANEEKLFELFGDLSEPFRAQFERSAKFAAYEHEHDLAEISQTEVDAFYRSCSNRLETASRIDKEAREKAQKAWNLLKRGEIWEKVAQEWSEDKLVDEKNESFSREWATVGADGFGYPNLAMTLPTLKQGDFSQPIETDEGLMIVKVVEEVGKNRTLARILFRMAQPVEVPDEQKVRANLLKDRRRDAQLALQAELLKKAKIDFPLGTNFTYKIWSEQPGK